MYIFRDTEACQVLGPTANIVAFDATLAEYEAPLVRQRVGIGGII